MIKCPKCGVELPDDAKFCGVCGAKLEVAAPVETPVEAPAEAAAPVAPKPKKEKKPFPVKLVAIIAGAVLAVVAIIVAIILIFGGAKEQKLSFYIKGNEIVFTDFNDDPVELTKKLLDADEDDIDASWNELSYTISSYIALTNKGNRVFYPDRINNDSQGATIYYRDLNKKNDPEKVDSDIVSYAVNDKGNFIVYLKADGSESGNLYYSDLNEKEKLASDVTVFVASDDAKKLIYMTSGNNLYFWEKGEEDTEKLASEISEIVDINSEEGYVYYIKEGNLYRQEIKVDGDKEKIAENVSDIIHSYDSGELYFTIGGEIEKSLAEFVFDDKAEEDAAIEYPVRADYPAYPTVSYPWSWDYDTTEDYDAAVAEYNRIWDEYNAECDRIDEEYNAAWKVYNEKSNRDQIRENLSYNTVIVEEISLYYYGGSGKPVLVTDSLADRYSVEASYDTAVLLAEIKKGSGKLTLSEYDYIWEIRDAVEYGNVDRTFALVIKEKLVELNVKDASNFGLSDDGKDIYYLMNTYQDEDSWYDMGDLYSARIEGDGISEGTKIDSDVAAYGIRYANGMLTYFKNVDYERDIGTLYMFGKEIEENVYMYNVTYVDGMLYYYVDYSSEFSKGTFKVYDGKKSSKIADDAVDFSFAADGSMLVLYDYDNAENEGKLGKYENGELEKLDKGVSALLYVSGGLMKGRYMYSEY